MPDQFPITHDSCDVICEEEIEVCVHGVCRPSQWWKAHIKKYMVYHLKRPHLTKLETQLINFIYYYY